LTRTNYLFRFHEGSIKKEQIVEFLKALKMHLKQPLLIIWDGLKLDFIVRHEVAYVIVSPVYRKEEKPVVPSTVAYRHMRSW